MDWHPSIDLEERTLDFILRSFENEDYRCYDCAHLHPDGYSCKAFPNGVPARLKAGQYRHTEVFSWQKGKYVFKKALNSEPSEDKKKEEKD